MSEMILTLFDLDNPVVASTLCPCCNRLLPNTGFYLESASKRKYVGQLRKHCKECWNKTNGKSKKTHQKSAISLFKEIDEIEGSVLHRIKTDGIYFGKIKYVPSKKAFSLEKDHSYNLPAVYFLIEEQDDKMLIHKVGKASGDRGLNGRFSKYCSNNVNSTCKMIANIHKVMTSKLRGKVLSVYYLPIPETGKSVSTVYDIECEYDATRELERSLAKKARKENHPMTLAKHN